MIQLSDIKNNPANPRLIKDKKFKELMESLRTFPRMMEMRPMVIDENNIILGGNMRRKALAELGYTEVPESWVLQITDLTEAQKKEFILKDNISYGEWDYNNLLKDWDNLPMKEWGLDIPDKKYKKELQDDGFTVPQTITTKIKVGDIYEIGPHRIICGDCLLPQTWESLMQGRKADCVNTDPPYNIDYTGGTDEKMKIENDNMDEQAYYSFLTGVFNQIVQFTNPGRGIYVFHADSHGLTVRRAFVNSGIMLKQCLVWAKNTFTIGRQDYQWMHEPCLYGWIPGASHYFVHDRTQGTVYRDTPPDFTKMPKPEMKALLEEIYGIKVPKTALYYDKPSRNFEHPTMKPIPMIGELIQNSCRQGEIVADPFGGSGTAMVAADMTDRVARIIELDPKFVQVTIDRMKTNNPSITVKKVKD